MSTHQFIPILNLMMMGKIKLRPPVRLVLLILAGIARGKAGLNAYPSIATLCRATGLDIKTVRAALETLRTFSGTPVKVQEKAANNFPTKYCFDMKILRQWFEDARAESEQTQLQIEIGKEDGRKQGKRLQPQASRDKYDKILAEINKTQRVA